MPIVDRVVPQYSTPGVQYPAARAAGIAASRVRREKAAFIVNSLSLRVIVDVLIYWSGYIDNEAWWRGLEDLYICSKTSM